VIKKYLEESQKLISTVAQNQDFENKLQDCIHLCIKTFESNGGVYFCGNGGSAAEAQHLSAEFSGRYKLNRRPLKSEALHVNTSFLTAVGNDFGFDHIYARALEAIANKNDLLFVLSTSGKSQNIINVAEKAKNIGCKTIALLGENSTLLHELCDIVIEVPSSNTPRIQEIHLLIGHIICEEVEKNLFT
jgi:D-sedoheptulose 7-phosphate isomerase